MAPPVDSTRNWRLSLLRGLIPSVCSVLIYGAWAWWANTDHGVSAARWAAATQGFVSFTTTMLTSLVMELAARYSGSRTQKFLFSSSLGFVVGTGLVVVAHIAMQTPQLWVTVTPSILAGAAYAIGYAAILVRLVP